MCNPFQEIVDFVDDAVDFTVDLVGDVIGWLIPQPDIPDFSEQFAEQQSKGILVNKFTANGHIPIAYGTRKVGGNIVFLETSGADNQYLYILIIYGV